MALQRNERVLNISSNTKIKNLRSQTLGGHTLPYLIFRNWES